MEYEDNRTRTSCICVGKHIPKVMSSQRHHIWPLEEGGSDTRENTITVCPTTHANIHMLWKIYDDVGGRPDWEILKNYSEFVRNIVERGRELRRASQALSQSA